MVVAGRSGLVAPIAEEGQVAGGEPVEEVSRLGDLLGRAWREAGAQFARDDGGSSDQRGRIRDDGPDRFQRVVQGCLDAFGAFRVGEPVDEYVHPRFTDATQRIQTPTGFAGHLDQCSADVPAHRQYRVEHSMNGHPGRRDGTDHRLDDIRHVVVDDVDHRGRGRPPARAFGHGGVEDPDRCRSWLTLAGQPEMAVDDADDIPWVTRTIFFRHVREIRPDQRLGLRAEHTGLVHRTRPTVRLAWRCRYPVGRCHRLHFLHSSAPLPQTSLFRKSGEPRPMSAFARRTCWFSIRTTAATGSGPKEQLPPRCPVSAGDPVSHFQLSRVSFRCVTRCGRAASAPIREILFFS